MGSEDSCSNDERDWEETPCPHGVLWGSEEGTRLAVFYIPALEEDTKILQSPWLDIRMMWPYVFTMYSSKELSQNNLQ